MAASRTSGGMLSMPGRGVEHDRRHGEDDQGDEHRPQRQRPPREQQADDADGRDRPPQPGEVGGEEPAAAGVPDRQADRQADRRRAEQRQQRVPQVLARGPRRCRCGPTSCRRSSATRSRRGSSSCARRRVARTPRRRQSAGEHEQRIEHERQDDDGEQTGPQLDDDARVPVRRRTGARGRRARSTRRR